MYIAFLTAKYQAAIQLSLSSGLSNTANHPLLPPDDNLGQNPAKR
jgi:hypothetical protein